MSTENKGKKHSNESALERLRAMPGLGVVADWVEGVLASGPEANLHLILTGRPGTGKTTAARLIAEVFAEHGILPSGHLVEVQRRDLVAGYVGQTAIQTMEVIESAMGGMLLIDEAYQLTPTGENDFAGEAVATVLKAMEDRKGRFSVVVAGYPEPMQAFLKSNEGLERRFADNIIEIPEYDAETLRAIFENMVAGQECTLAPELKEALPVFFKNWWRANHRRRDFGFAGEVKDKLFAGCETRRRARMARLPPEDPHRLALTLADIPEAYRQYLPSERQDDLNSLLAELDAMEGLEAVKQKVRQIVALQKYAIAQQPNTPPHPGHYVFAGSPGTGKTTVARLMGGILKSLGCLKRGHVVEVKRADLVADYVGQTAIKTKERLKDAVGGVLFLDEAYSLVKGNQDSFGKEALDTLLAFMEDHRHDLCVILVGSPCGMRVLMESNPGLPSRLSSTFVFDNFTPAELLAIFRLMAAEQKLTLDEGVPEALLPIFEAWVAVNDPHFGNAREVRKLFETARQNIAVRVMHETGGKRPDDLSALRRMTTADIPAQRLAGEQPTVDVPEESSACRPNRTSGLCAVVEMSSADATRFARMTGRMMLTLGYLKGEIVVEATRDDLVSGYVGQTSLKTREMLERAQGGILLIHEADALAAGFGMEALETLAEAAKDHPPSCVIILTLDDRKALAAMENQAGEITVLN